MWSSTYIVKLSFCVFHLTVMNCILQRPTQTTAHQRNHSTTSCLVVTRQHNVFDCTVYNIMQIVTGSEVNSEAYFPQLREIRLTIDDDSHYLFCYTSDRNGDWINLIISVILHWFIYTTATITNLCLSIRSRDVMRLCGLIKFIYCIKCYL